MLLGGFRDREVGNGRGSGDRWQKWAEQQGVPQYVDHGRALLMVSPGVKLVPAPQQENLPEQLRSVEACVGLPRILTTKSQAGHR